MPSKETSLDPGLPDLEYVPARSPWSRRRGIPALRFLLLTIVFTAVAMLLQWSAGCYRTELSGYPDEPAHLITGLMVRDYVTSGWKTSPIQFAENYYLHYPKVGFGMWPPLFHFTEGAWFLLAPPRKTSAFALQALIAGLLAASVSFLAIRRFGWTIGLFAGAAFVALPNVQGFTAMIMADNLMALLAFWAMIAFAAYLGNGKMWTAVLFGALAGLALMTKSNAAALAVLPFAAIVLMRDYRRLFSLSFIAAGVTAAIVAVPWQLLVMRFWTATVSANSYSVGYALHMLRIHVAMYLTNSGPIILVLALIGFVVKVVLPYRRRSIEPIWASAAALMVALFLFGFAPLPAEPRYHVASWAAMALFAAAGAATLAGLPWGRSLPSHWKTGAVVAGAAALYMATTFYIPTRRSYGFTEVASAVVSNPNLRDAVMLVSSENFGEGMLITEVALREPRPSHYILRASKMLSRSRWDLDRYELLYATPEAMSAYLKSIPVRLLVIDNTPGPVPVPHHDILNTMVKQYKDDWKLVDCYPKVGPVESRGLVCVYECPAAAGSHKQISIDMRYTLKKILE